MRVLLLSATTLECLPCLQWLDNNPELPVDRLISGVGQLAAAVALQKQVLQKRPQLIIQAGIAGSTDPGDIGRMFSVESEILADLGVSEPAGFLDLFDLGLADPEASPFRGGKLTNPWKKLIRMAGNETRPGLTVNQISTDRKELGLRKQKYAPFVESMEGAALHYIALKEDIPFLQLRAISNETGDRDKSRWKIKESIAVLNASLQILIQKMVTANETDIRL